jgi:superfamily II DNA or RNA helicase
VRAQRWLVTDLRAFDNCAIVTLAGTGASNLGIERRVIAPFEHLAPIAVHRRLRNVRRTEWRRACRTLVTADGSSTILRTAVAARMDLLPHQLEPALAMVRGLGSRVLIADEVGLGKTIQAGLVIAELLARGAASRVLVLVPAGVRDQWIDELWTRFGLRLTLLDAATVKRRIQQLPAGVNPWTIEPMVVTSIDYVKRPEIAPAVLTSRWDIVVVDEAHGAVQGSDRHGAVAALGASAPYVLLLTATPHNGDARAFMSLSGIGAHGDELLIFRRTRLALGLQQPRHIHRLHVRPSAAERRMHACLNRFAAAVERDHRANQPDVGLALATLRKRGFSSAFSLERSVRRRLASLAGEQEPLPSQRPLPLDDPDGELDRTDDLPAWTIPVLHDPREERRLLSTLLEAAREASIRESKLLALARLLRRLREPVVIFTEYRDTLLHVHDVVAPQAAILHGGLTRHDRRRALACFADGATLLATDAAGEGLNLHHSSRIVINLELPWNPMRLEQRIGRVDRIGQKRRVHVFHLIGRDTGEIRLVERLSARVAAARADIGAADPLSLLNNADVADHVTTTPLVRLPEQAAAELERLRAARRFARRQTSVHVTVALADTPAMTRARRPTTRAWLGSRTLVILQSMLSDVTGRIVASHALPVLASMRRGHQWSLADFDALATFLADVSLAEWREATETAHHVFWQTRRHREIAIARALAGHLPREAQSGLFDGRADRERQAAATRTRHIEEESARNIEGAHRLAALHFHPLLTALVLRP